MQIDWQRVLPVVVSIFIIIIVALARQYSRTLAAIVATMPINIPLALWVISSGEGGDQKGMVQFIEGLFIGLIPLLGFMGAAYFAARAGWSLVPMLVVGYLAWGVVLGATLIVQALLKR